MVIWYYQFSVPQLQKKKGTLLQKEIDVQRKVHSMRNGQTEDDNNDERYHYDAEVDGSEDFFSEALLEKLTCDRVYICVVNYELSIVEMSGEKDQNQEENKGI